MTPALQLNGAAPAHPCARGSALFASPEGVRASLHIKKKAAMKAALLLQFPIYLRHQGHIHASRLLPCSHPVLVLLEHPCKHPCHRFNIDANDGISRNRAFEILMEPLNKRLKKTSLPPSWGKEGMGVSRIKDLHRCTPTPALGNCVLRCSTSRIPALVPLQGGGGLNKGFLKDGLINSEFVIPAKAGIQRSYDSPISRKP